MRENILNEILNFLTLILMFLMKHIAVIAVSVASALMDMYSRRKTLVTFWDRALAVIFKVGFGSTVMIMIKPGITNDTALIVLTSVVTIGGEEFAVWVSQNVKTILTKLFDLALSVFKVKLGDNSSNTPEEPVQEDEEKSDNNPI